MAKGLTRDVCLKIVGLTKHQFYYKLSDKRPGKQPTTTTPFIDKATGLIKEVEDEQLINDVIAIKSNEDLEDHYKLICVSLCLQGYYINHKKLYRIMKSQGLLNEKVNIGSRTFVKFKRISATKPLTGIEMDIKYFKIHGSGKYAYVLTVIDTFTRYVLKWDVGYSMRSIQVKKVWDYIVINYLQGRRQELDPLDIEIRTDNGKQFVSNQVRKFFSENGLNHVCTHPYSPEENGHIESFHKTLGKALENDYFVDLKALSLRLEKFYNNYNNRKGHSAILGLNPKLFWALYENNYIEVIELEHKVIKFKLKVAYQDISKIPNIYEYRVIRA